MYRFAGRFFGLFTKRIVFGGLFRRHRRFRRFSRRLAGFAAAEKIVFLFGRSDGFDGRRRGFDGGHIGRRFAEHALFGLLELFVSSSFDDLVAFRRVELRGLPSAFQRQTIRALNALQTVRDVVELFAGGGFQVRAGFEIGLGFVGAPQLRK